MGDKIRKSPNIRFAGFTDDWEERKFSDLYKKINEKNDLSFGMERIISVANMYYKNESNANSSEEYMKTYNIFRIGDIAFEGNKSKNYSYGRFVENDIGDGIISHVFDVFRPIVKYDLWFWKYMINNENVMAHVLRRVTTKATMMNNLVAKDFLKAKILVPKIEEQAKVGRCFKQLDNLITLHQRKLDLLKATKKSMLQKMFPKNGESVPEIRFAGFTGDWEERKLGEVLSLLKDGTHGTHVNVDDGDGCYLLSAKNIKNGKIVIEGTDRRISRSDYESIHKTYNLQKDDVLLTIVGSIGESAIIENTDNITFQRSVAYLRPTTDISSQFLFTLINTGEFQHELKTRQVISAQAGIYLGQLEIIPIRFPEKEEQIKIGEYFKNLDNLITLHQRELDLLKDLKKSMLKQMFI